MLPRYDECFSKNNLLLNETPSEEYFVNLEGKIDVRTTHKVDNGSNFQNYSPTLSQEQEMFAILDARVRYS